MIKIALLLTLTSLTGLNAPAILVGGSEEPPDSGTVEESKASEEIVENIEKTIEKVTREYFEDIPIMAEIAKCESNFRHFNGNGEVLRGLVNRQDVGIMQINERFHLERSKKLGMDIYTVEGNLEFARFLYEREGSKPWNASKKCWNK